MIVLSIIDLNLRPITYPPLPIISMTFTKLTEIPIYGHFSIKIWGLMVAIGMLVGLFIATKEAKRKKQNPDEIINLFTWIIISSVIGSRLLYVILFWQNYSSNLLDIFKIWEGGLVFYGGIFAAILTIYIYSKIKNKNFWQIADIMAPGFAIGIFFGRIGCFLIGDHIGSPVHWFPFGSTLLNDNILRHEVSAYLSLNGLITFLLLWSLRKKFPKTGQIAYIFLIYYSFTRFLLDFFRAQDLRVIDPRFYELTISQWLSALVFIFAIYKFY